MRWRRATSASLGTLSRMSVLSVSRLAIISGKVAFFAPEIGLAPLSLCPPQMRMRSMPRLLSGKRPHHAATMQKSLDRPRGGVASNALLILPGNSGGIVRLRAYRAGTGRTAFGLGLAAFKVLP